MSQCDGCAAAMPKKLGIHYHEHQGVSLPYMVCQSYRYQQESGNGASMQVSRQGGDTLQS